MNLQTVSIVVTTMNRPELVLRAIRSVFAQTFPDYDLHVVDDGSTDQTSEVVEQFLSGRENAFYWRHESCRGLCAARNTGIAKSKGDFIAFLDDDDEWKPEALEKRVELLEEISEKGREKLGVIYCGCEIHILHENRITYNMPKIEGNIRKYIIDNDLSTIPSSCLFPKKVLQKIGGFDEGLLSSVDHDIWMNLASHGYHAFAIKEPLVVTYHTKRHKSMVIDSCPRMQGVEQYLTKWAPTFEEWFGGKESKSYIQYYRTRVLGGLAARKLVERDFGEAAALLRHVVVRNRYSLKSFKFLLKLIGVNLVRTIVPDKVIEYVKNRCEGN